jgi:hypothetical protein
LALLLRLDEHAGNKQWIPPNGVTAWLGAKDQRNNSIWTSFHDLLFNGEVDGVTRRRKSLFSNTLVLPAFDGLEAAKIDDTKKLDSLKHTLSLRGRHLESAIFNSADLRKTDLEGAQLQGASLFRAELQGAMLDHAQLQGASLDIAELRDCRGCRCGQTQTPSRSVESLLTGGQSRQIILQKNPRKWGGEDRFLGRSLGGRSPRLRTHTER